jgi:hypothetical protein
MRTNAKNIDDNLMNMNFSLSQFRVYHSNTKYKTYGEYSLNLREEAVYTRHADVLTMEALTVGCDWHKEHLNTT